MAKPSVTWLGRSQASAAAHPLASAALFNVLPSRRSSVLHPPCTSIALHNSAAPALQRAACPCAWMVRASGGRGLGGLVVRVVLFCCSAPMSGMYSTLEAQSLITRCIARSRRRHEVGTQRAPTTACPLTAKLLPPMRMQPRHVVTSAAAVLCWLHPPAQQQLCRLEQQPTRQAALRPAERCRKGKHVTAAVIIQVNEKRYERA